ncbi:MAG: MerR family transcriptional regulator [Defluviitaleaceae bacterium]|nr:MerR family transcriptional regulator [Defluviitaleaceae bacterium]
MIDDGLFTISEFARFTRTTRDTLLHYDRIGLLSPNKRGENNYRMYSSDQLAVVNVIRTMQRLGMQLSEVKTLKDNRNPAFTEQFFAKQVKNIDEKIDEWVCAKKLLLTLQETIHEASGADENELTIKFMPEQAIALGEPNDYGRGRDDYDALISFYHHMQKKHPHMDMNYPVWAIFKRERILRGDWKWPDRYYFYNPEGTERKPASLYAIGYARGGYGQSDGLYERLLAYVNNSGFCVSGDAFEEYPQNEVCIADSKSYLIRVMIAVTEKR